MTQETKNLKINKMAVIKFQIVLSCFFLVNGFNLDPRVPIVKTAGFDSESYFGYSVAQHRTLRSTEYGEPVLLVGAPRDQNLQPETNRSGALWQCKLTADPKVRENFTLSLFSLAKECS